MKKKILIVGGGISGLVAASMLAEKNFVTILEAAATCGGRIKSKWSKDFPCVIEPGAEFIHGDLKETINLLKDAAIAYVPVEGKMYRKENGILEEQKDMIEGWDKLLAKMKHADKDETMFDFLQQHFGEDKYAALRRQAVNYTEGFDVADVKKVTVQSLYKEWVAEDEDNFRIPEGYSALIDSLITTCESKGCTILNNEIVKQIDWEKNNVSVITSKEKKYDADKIIITVPISVLQTTASEGSINFTPALDEQINAAKQIGFGTVIKVLCSFHQSFWKTDMGFVFGDEYFPTWWTQLPDTGNMLTGWAGGGKADQLNEESDEELLEKALMSLSNIFDISLAEIKSNLKAAEVFNWKNEPLSHGAYSYDMPGSIEAKKLLSKPVEDTVFFCGEAIYEGTSPGTVEAAIISAKEMVKKL